MEKLIKKNSEREERGKKKVEEREMGEGGLMNSSCLWLLQRRPFKLLLSWVKKPFADNTGNEARKQA
jgi:hypothetical protein